MQLPSTQNGSILFQRSIKRSLDEPNIMVHPTYLYPPRGMEIMMDPHKADRLTASFGLHTSC